MLVGTFLTTLLLMLDEIALMVERLGTASGEPSKAPARPLEVDKTWPHAASGNGRELHVIWAVAKGSVLIKVFLVPAALVIGAFAPWAVVPLLVAGGLYLCLQGAEALFRGLRFQRNTETVMAADVLLPRPHNVEHERKTINAALRIDFVVSVEIIVITLATVTGEPLLRQLGVLAAVAIFATVGVYGSVAVLLRLEEIGGYLGQGSATAPGARLRQALGRAFVASGPAIRRALKVVGVAAAFFIGGGLITLGLPSVEKAFGQLVDPLADIAIMGEVVGWFAGAVLDTVLGVVVGAVAMTAVLAARAMGAAR